MCHILKWYLAFDFFYIYTELGSYSIKVSDKIPLILLNSRFLSCTEDSMFLVNFIYNIILF